MTTRTARPGYLSNEIATQLEPIARGGIFGVMGGDTAALLTDLAGRGVPLYRTRHENHGVAMADGYAWATGRVAVATLTYGPGFTNAATAARTAANAGRKVLIVSGDSATGSDAVVDNKYLDHGAVAAALGVDHVSVTRAEDAMNKVGQAIRKAASGRTVLLTIAVDILNGPSPRQLEAWAPAAPPTGPPEASAEDVQAIADALCSSRRPLILVGQGASSPQARLIIESLAERVGALIGTTLPARGLFAGSRFDLGVVGGYASDTSAPVLGTVDCVLALGTSLSFFTTAERTLFHDARILHVDVDPKAIGRNQAVHLRVVADAATTVELVLRAIGEGSAEITEFRDPDLLARLAGPSYTGPDESTSDRLDPRALMRALDALLPMERSIVLDSGRFMTSPGRYLRTSAPHTIRHTADAGSIGLGLGVAAGASIGRPDLANLLFVGDGGMAMSVTELETAARYSAPLAIIVMNDSAYGSEIRHLEADELTIEHATFPEYDFAPLAEAVGVEAATVRTMAEVHEIAPRLHGRTTPILVDVKIRQDLAAQRITWPMAT